MDKEKLDSIERDLEKLQEEFNIQMQAIDQDVSEFHKQLISLGVNQPEQKELIEFVVFVNDKLDSKQIQFSQVINETVKEMILHKRELIHINKQMVSKCLELEAIKTESFWSTAWKTVTNLKDLKIVLGIGSVIILIGIKIFLPEQSLELMQYLVSLFL